MDDEDKREPGGVSGEQLEGWFRQYYAAVFHFFARRGFDPADCQDLAQETFLAAFRARKQFRGDAKVGTWIFSIAQNRWKNHLRYAGQQKRSAQVIPLETARDSVGDNAPAEIRPPQDNPLDMLLEQEIRQRLLDAIQQLPSQMRRCALLRYGQHLKYKEIAALLHLHIDTVKSHLHQAGRKLQGMLSDPGTTDPPSGGNHDE